MQRSFFLSGAFKMAIALKLVEICITAAVFTVICFYISRTQRGGEKMLIYDLLWSGIHLKKKFICVYYTHINI